MSALSFPRAAKQLCGSKLRSTATGVTISAPWGSHLDFDASPMEAAELAAFFGALSAAFLAHAKAKGGATIAEAEQTPAPEALGSVEASEAFPDVDPHVVALPKVKRAYNRKAKP